MPRPTAPVRAAPARVPLITAALLGGLVVLLALAAWRPAAAESGLPLPRFVSVGSGEVNLRTGPGERYPILWVLKREGLPVMIVDEVEHWRQIRLADGAKGWVHRSLLSGRRTLRVIVPEVVLRRRAEDASAPLARLTDGVIMEALRCDEAWCQGEVRRFRGWVRREAVWGVLPEERFE